MLINRFDGVHFKCITMQFKKLSCEGKGIGNQIIRGTGQEKILLSYIYLCV